MVNLVHRLVVRVELPVLLILPIQQVLHRFQLVAEVQFRPCHVIREQHDDAAEIHQCAGIDDACPQCFGKHVVRKRKVEITQAKRREGNRAAADKLLPRDACATAQDMVLLVQQINRGNTMMYVPAITSQVPHKSTESAISR